MTDKDGADDYDSFAFVPDRIDQITASGLKQLHEALNERNRAKLRSVPIEEQGALLWALVDKDTIDVDLTDGRLRSR